jgi:hypothetical protein
MNYFFDTHLLVISRLVDPQWQDWGVIRTFLNTGIYRTLLNIIILHNFKEM